MTDRHQPAQVIALFALGLIPLLAVVGLVTDGGMLYVQRRTAQNGADAAAMAGTRALRFATSASDSTVATAVCKYVLANAFGVSPTATASFIDSSGAVVGAIGLTATCQGTQPSSTIPTTAAGVQVTSTISGIPTYLVGLIGINSLAASASASSTVQALYSINPTGNQAVAACGAYMYDTALTPSTNQLYNIFVSGTPPNIDYATYSGHNFLLLGSTLKNGPNNYPMWPTCPGANGTGFWGAIQGTGPISLPSSIVSDLHGDYDVSSGLDSLCTSSGQPVPTFTSSNCYVPIPVSDTNNTSSTAHIVALACMQLFGMGTSQSSRWTGTLSNASQCPPASGATYGAWSWHTTGILKIGLSS